MKKIKFLFLAMLTVSFFALASCEDDAADETEDAMEDVDNTEFETEITPADENLLQDTTVIIDENAQ